MLANQIRLTTLSAAIVFRVHAFLAKKHRELPFWPLPNILLQSSQSLQVWSAAQTFRFFFKCVCVFSSHSFWTSSSLDVSAGVTQEEGHTGFFIHLVSAVRALMFYREKDSAIPFPPVGHFYLSFLVFK